MLAASAWSVADDQSARVGQRACAVKVWASASQVL